MNYEGIQTAVCDAQESDWLDVSYSKRKYVKPQRAAKALRLKGKMWYVVAAVVCVAVMASLLFLDGDFKKEVFDAVKSASATVFGGQREQNYFDVPANVTLENVQDGVMTFSGGRAALCFSAGEVSDVSETSVTVKMQDGIAVVYQNLTDVLVNLGDEVQINSLLGKYKDSFSACILQDGEVVTDVVGSQGRLDWTV